MSGEDLGNLVQRINKLLVKGGVGNLTPWQLCQVRGAIELLQEERFAQGERTMSEDERPDLYEPAGFAANEPTERQRLVDQLKATVSVA